MVGVGLGILRGRSGPAWLLSRIRARTPGKKCLTLDLIEVGADYGPPDPFRIHRMPFSVGRRAQPRSLRDPCGESTLRAVITALSFCKICAEPRCGVAIREAVSRSQFAIVCDVSGPGSLTLRCIP